MARDIKVTVEDKPRPSKPAEQSIEDRIREAAAKFYSELSGDIERQVTEMLEGGYRDMLHNIIGIKPDHWRKGIEFDLSYSHTELAKELRTKANARARELLDDIDFSQITLTSSEVNAIKNAYRTQLKGGVTDAARRLAEEDARRVAAQVLGLPE